MGIPQIIIGVIVIAMMIPMVSLAFMMAINLFREEIFDPMEWWRHRHEERLRRHKEWLMEDMPKGMSMPEDSTVDNVLRWWNHQERQ